MRRSSAIVLGLSAFALATVFEAPSGNASTNQSALPDTAQITTAMIAAGRQVFHGAGNCLLCHGQDLEGTPIAPTLQAHKWKDATNGTLPEIYRVITHGVDGTAMISHPNGISDAQAVNVAVYVWSVSHGKAKP